MVSRWQPKGIYIGQFKCTGYNNVSSQCDSTPDITATGRRIVMGYSGALDPKYWRRALREGWIFSVEGIGDVRADDTGSKIIGRLRMDIAVATKQQARAITGYRRVYLKRPFCSND
jgi:3D (Asp-Asp-Asp) domain-containing protein